MIIKNDGGTAFPVLERGGGGLELTSTGMSLRDHFAGLALLGQISSGSLEKGMAYASIEVNEKAMAEASYALADAMLEARK